MLQWIQLFLRTYFDLSKLNIGVKEKLSKFPMSVKFMYTWYARTLFEQLTLSLDLHGEEYWENHEKVIKEISQVSGLSISSIVAELKKHQKSLGPSQVSKNRNFKLIREKIYERESYPISEHIYYASAEHVIRRKEFVLNQIRSIDLEECILCDLGVGPSVILTSILTEKPLWVAHGVDVSDACVHYAKKMLELYHLTHRVTIQQADVQALPYKEGVFDVVIATEIIEHLSNPKIGLKELNRILRPDGYAIIAIPLRLPLLEHLYTFTNEEEIRQMYEESGLFIEHFETWQSGGPFVDTFALCKKSI